MRKPYTPGLLTAWLLAAMAVISIVLLNRDHLVNAGCYAVGTILMIDSFLCMDIVIFWGLGKAPAEIVKAVRKQKK